MDLHNIGQFIAKKRKEKRYTQAELADKLQISEKTISKWECGHGLPDISLILPLCTLLSITANELLSAKELHAEEVSTHADKNIVSLLQEKKDNNIKRIAATIIFLLNVFIFLGIAFLFQVVQISATLRIVIIVIVIVLFVASIFVMCVIDRSIGCFQCPKCGYKFVPTLKAFILGKHNLFHKRLRRLKCPFCHQKSYCKHLNRK